MLKLKNNKNIDPNQTPNPYSIDKLSKMKPGVKIGFLKYWVIGASFLLSHMTPPFASQDGSTEKVAMVLIATLMMEFMANNIIIWMHNDKTPTYDYLPFGFIERKSIKSLFSTMLYVIIIVTATFFLNYGINILSEAIRIPTIAGLFTGYSDSVEPFSFALYFLIIDFIWFRTKKLIIKLKNRNKDDKGNDENEI